MKIKKKNRKFNVFIILLTLVFYYVPAEANIFSDGFRTVGLWHMDESITDTNGLFVPDDDINHSRNNNLQLGTASSPSITSGGSGRYGEALLFNGIDQISFADWPGGFSVKIDFWVYINDLSKNQTITAATGVWDIQVITNGKIRAYVYDKTAAPSWVDVPASSGWNHIVLLAEPGNIALEVNNESASNSTFTGLRYMSTTLAIGNKEGSTRWFNGMIDEFNVSNPSKVYVPTEPYPCSSCSTHIWHLDEVYSSSDTVLSPGCGDPNDSYGLEMLYGGLEASPGYGPSIASGLSGFGNSLYFNGTTDSARVENSYRNNLGIDSEEFSFEAWLKSDAPTYGHGDRYGIMYHESRFALRLEDNADGWLVRFICWGEQVSQSITAIYPNPNEWHHVIAEFYKGRMTLYIDGVVKTIRTVGTPEFVKNDPLQMSWMYIGGRENSTLIERFRGSMDEIRFSRSVSQLCCDYNIADINQDCQVGIFDLMIMAEQWLGTAPN